MALLRLRRTQQRVYLAERSLVGRSASSWVISDRQSVSNDHAVLFYHRDRWLIRDLGSTNGSFVNEQSLKPGQTLRLTRGTELRFGGESAVLENIEPPTACALCLTSGRYYSAVQGVMTLPEEVEPLLTVYQSADESWVVEGEEEYKTATDGEVLHAGDRRFRLHIPSATVSRVNVSTQEGGALLTRANVELVFNVSSDEESMAVELRASGNVVRLSPRQSHEVLLELARSRLLDRREGTAEEECGWVYADDLATRLAYNKSHLNVAIHRVRRQFAEAGLVDAAQLFERRPTSQQIRLGIAQLRVVSNQI